MLFPVSRDIFRWSTPDPGDNWMMVGHLILSDEGVILVDPPNVPGLTDAIARLGRFDSVILTTGDHVRGSEYFDRVFNVQIYAPIQGEGEIDGGSASILKQLNNLTFFDEGDKLPGNLSAMRARVPSAKTAPSLDEVMLLTPTGELLSGDIATGSRDGKLLTRNEFFYASPNPDDNAICLRAISDVVRKSKANSLLASHGFDLLEGLQQALGRR